MYQQTKLKILENLNKTLLKLDFSLIEATALEANKDITFGFLSSNIAFLIAARYHKNVVEVAKQIAENLPAIPNVDKLEPTNNGYINFFLSKGVFNDYYARLIKHKNRFGSRHEVEQQYAVEIVSANPSGLLHLGHVRSAIYTDVICNLLEFFGRKVLRLYLINDCGTQTKEIVRSVFAKYNFLLYGTFFEERTQIKYNTIDAESCAKEMIKQKGSTWTYGKKLEDKEFYAEIKEFVVNYFISGIRKELKMLDVPVHIWDSEERLTDENGVQAAISKIKDYVYVSQGALWFKTSHFDQTANDDVIIKSNDEVSYFGQDLVYHLQKINYLNMNGKIINCFACDHEGHIQRLSAFFKALNMGENRLIFKTIQLAQCIDDGKKLTISKRKNTLITVKDLFNMFSYEEIRWFFASKEAGSELTIDMAKLKSKSYNNPIFYILYAYARIEQILSKVEDSSLYIRELDFDALTEREDLEIIAALLNYECMLDTAITKLSPQICCLYVFQIAQYFHPFYEKCEILKTENNNLRNQRLALCFAVKQIIFNCLKILRIKPKSKI